MEWNKDDFVKKILNPDLYSPEIGPYSGNPRDFEWEKSMKEYDPIKKDAQIWMGKGERKWFQKIVAYVLRKWVRTVREPIRDSDEYHYPVDSVPQIYAVGQSHLDLGYRWRYIQTTEKIKVTGEKFCYHIGKIPEFTFTISQPVMLEWTMEKYPGLFRMFQEAAEKGQLELAGGSYCEPDCHLISGESWCRQRLYGQLFYYKYFGKYAVVEWVPDSFGFTATLPQFIAKSAGEYLFTKKMFWNDATCFPFLNYWWQSKDGSRILVRSESGSKRRRIFTHWQNFYKTALLLKKGVIDESPEECTFNYESAELEGFINGAHPGVFSHELMPYHIFLYGQSDGGHGPRGIEAQAHLALHRQGLVELSTAEHFFRKVEQDYGDRLPIWEDEMYLEYHRGTITTSPIIKRMNRFFEWQLPSAEKFAMLGCSLAGAEFPQAALDECWKFTLLNQFHDILPGSHPPETIDDIWGIWQTTNEKLNKIYSHIWSQLEKVGVEIPREIQEMGDPGDKIMPMLVFNPTSFPISDTIEVELSDDQNEINLDDFILVDSGGDLRPFTIIESMDCNEPLYSLPRRIAICLGTTSLKPDSISRFFLIGKKAEKSDEIGVWIEKDAENSLSVRNANIIISLSRKTGACTSIRLRNNLDEWIETLRPGEKRLMNDQAILPGGILPHAFYEYSDVYAAWDLYKRSRYYNYPMRFKKVSILHQDPACIRVQSEFELKTPLGSKIDVQQVAPEDESDSELGKKSRKQIRPRFPPRETWTDTSNFKIIYTIFKDDTMIHMDFMADFHAEETVIKLDIPTSTNADRIDCEIAYGIQSMAANPSISRDRARWEKVMHTWTNLQSADGSWGFSVLNNGKYGLDCNGGYIGLTLVRGKKYPKPFFNILRKSWLVYERKRRKKAKLGEPPEYTSQGQHIWRFKLFPHLGDSNEARVLQRAHIFNTGVASHSLSPQVISLEGFIQKDGPIIPKVDFPIEISAYKMPHQDGDAADWFGASGIDNCDIAVCRLINWSESEVSQDIRLPGSTIRAQECDILEQKNPDLGEIQMEADDEKGKFLTLNWKPFEVKTLAILKSD